MKKEPLKYRAEKLIKAHIELKIIFLAVILLFIFFLAAPIIMLLLKSFQSSGGDFWVHYMEVFGQKGFWTAVKHSLCSAGLSALATTVLAFLLAYSIQYTNIPNILKRVIRTGAVLPMLLPTITYGFALIYSF